MITLTCLFGDANPLVACNRYSYLLQECSLGTDYMVARLVVLLMAAAVAMVRWLLVVDWLCLLQYWNGQWNWQWK